MALMTIESVLAEQIATETQVSLLLADAARTERFLSKPRPPNAPAMYDLLATSYEVGDWSYYEKALLKLRATPRQITRWDFAIDVLLAVDINISKDPVLDRQILWMRANRYKWTHIAKHFGFNRSTLKSRYTNLLCRLCRKIKKEIKFDKLNEILYLI